MIHRPSSLTATIKLSRTWPRGCRLRGNSPALPDGGNPSMPERASSVRNSASGPQPPLEDPRSGAGLPEPAPDGAGCLKAVNSPIPARPLEPEPQAATFLIEAEVAVRKAQRPLQAALFAEANWDQPESSSVVERRDQGPAENPGRSFPSPLSQWCLPAGTAPAWPAFASGKLPWAGKQPARLESRRV